MHLRQTRNRPAWWGAVVVIVGLFILPGCSGESNRKPFLARVGTTELTEDDLIRDSVAGRVTPSASAVNDWIVDELLYQEAARRGLTNTDQFRRQVDAAKRRLAIAALLEQELYAPADTTLVNEAAVAQAYAASAAQYVLHEDVVLASYALFADRETANTFRSALLRGTTWTEALQQLQTNQAITPLLLQAATRQYFTQQTMYPQELWKLTRSLGRDEVSFVLKVKDAFYVVKAYGLKRPGDVADLEYIRNDVRQRLLIDERRARYQRLVGDLRAKHGVEIRMDRTDSTSGAGE
jgi:hypothetical protein